MKSYRPKLLRESAAAAQILSKMLDKLDTGPGAEGEGDGFLDGCGSNVGRGEDRARKARCRMWWFGT